MEIEEDLVKNAEKKAGEKLIFFIHIGVYILVNLLLITVWLSTGDTFPWFIFPLIGWGIGLGTHFISVYAGTTLLDRLTERELRRLKNKNR